MNANDANDEGMYVFEQHPRIFCVILGVSGKQSGVSGNQSGNGKSGPFLDPLSRRLLQSSAAVCKCRLGRLIGYGS